MKNQRYIIAKSGIPKSGLGLFATTDFKKGEDILEITGSKSLSKGEYITLLAKGTGTWQYAIEVNDELIIDMNSLTCIARCANDARKSKFKNNAAIEYSNSAKLFYVATKNIKAGEEIFVNYGSAYWKAHDTNIKRDILIQKLLKIGLVPKYLDDYSGWWYELNIPWNKKVSAIVQIDLDNNTTVVEIAKLEKFIIAESVDIISQKLNITTLPKLIKSLKPNKLWK